MNVFRCQRYHECAQIVWKHNVLGGRSTGENCVSIAPARADRWLCPPGNHKKHKGNTICEASRSGCRCFTEDCKIITSSGRLFGSLLIQFRCPGRLHHGTSLAIGAITAKAWGNTTFLMAQWLEHCKIRVEGFWPLRKTTIWLTKVKFYWGLRNFPERWVGSWH